MIQFRDFHSRLNVIDGDRPFDEYQPGEQDTNEDGYADNDQGEVYDDRPCLMALWDERVVRLLRFPALLGTQNTDEGCVDTNDANIMDEDYSELDNYADDEWNEAEEDAIEDEEEDDLSY